MEREFFSFFASFRGGSARRPAEMATADLLKDSKPPLTLRPNFNCERGNVTAAAAACLPRRGIFVDENLWKYIARVLNLSRNLRVIFDLVAQVKCELFSFFASFFLFSKEKKKRNSL